jgi:beta-galactosidase/beta-glucuronidase
MDDGMKRVSRERLEPYFRLHRDANYNMVRNWTGESTEELFYELSDEYGMLVWNDFWLSTEGYNLDVNDNDLFMANATDVVKRFRNHPSIAIWCPRNEGYAPAQLEPRLAELIATEDGTRHYAPNSRNLNLRPSGPWHYLKDAGEYYRNHAEGFSTELGTPSVPTAATMRSFIPAEDQWPVSDTWYYHDLHDGQKDYIHAMESRYGKTTGLDDFCKKAQ